MKILFLGHSLVEYFDWRGRFPGHDLHNLGVAGETTGGLMARLESVAAVHDGADLVLVMTGTNDLLMGDGSFPSVFRLLAAKLGVLWPDARVVFFSVLPAHPEWIDVATVAGINEELGAIARGAGAEFLDLTHLFTDTDNKVRLDLLLEDGVHLSSEGYRVWSEVVDELLQESS